jgi:hypothetical protein
LALLSYENALNKGKSLIVEQKELSKKISLLIDEISDLGIIER